MKASEQTIQQIVRTVRKVAQKFTVKDDEDSVLTDLHVRVSQESGELLVLDDDENEITRCVVEQWIDNKDEDFYASIAELLRDVLRQNHEVIDSMGILKPFSFVLEDDDKESVAELYLADDDTAIIGGNLMKDLDKDLDSFIDNLLKKD